MSTAAKRKQPGTDPGRPTSILAFALILSFAASACRGERARDGIETGAQGARSNTSKKLPAYMRVALAPPLSAQAVAPGKARARYVILVSVDGMATRFVRELIEKGDMPSIARLKREGAFTENARTDFFHTTTVANHTCMLTGLPTVHTTGFPPEAHHGYIHNMMPEAGRTLHDSGNPNLDYVYSVYDVAHDAGLFTCLFASKKKFVIYKWSYDEKNGAPDAIPTDNGRNKIDVAVIDADTGSLVEKFLAQQKSRACNFALLHLADPDLTGHGHGWGSAEYLDELVKSDRLIGKVLADIETDPGRNGRTALLVTSDHGGIEKHHLDRSRPESFVIPFYVWAPGAIDVSGGRDLYALLGPARRDPGEINPPYETMPPPIRNGDAGNLALELLGLPAIPGSLMFVPAN